MGHQDCYHSVSTQHMQSGLSAGGGTLIRLCREPNKILLDRLIILMTAVLLNRPALELVHEVLKSGKSAHGL